MKPARHIAVGVVAIVEPPRGAAQSDLQDGDGHRGGRGYVASPSNAQGIAYTCPSALSSWLTTARPGYERDLRESPCVRHARPWVVAAGGVVVLAGAAGGVLGGLLLLGWGRSPVTPRR